MENIKVGDRVKATHENGDTAEFKAVQVTSDSYVSASNWYYRNEGWKFEKIEPPLPTEPGIYQDVYQGSPMEHAVTYRLGVLGWTDMTNTDFDVTNRVKEAHNAGRLVRLVRENL